MTSRVSVGAADQPAAEVVTGRELRLVSSPAQADAVRFERVAVDAHPPVASHLEAVAETPIIATERLILAPPRRTQGRSRCGCWQSLRVLGSIRRHDHDHLTGSSSSFGCPACGRGIPTPDR